MKIAIHIFSASLLVSTLLAVPNLQAQFDPTEGLEPEKTGTDNRQSESVENYSGYEREGGLLEPLERNRSNAGVRSTEKAKSNKTKSATTKISTPKKAITNTPTPKREEFNTAKDLVSPLDLTNSNVKSNQPPANSKAPQQSNQADTEDDSVLSFNLFYYMIQKFKFSDLEE